MSSSWSKKGEGRRVTSKKSKIRQCNQANPVLPTAAAASTATTSTSTYTMISPAGMTNTSSSHKSPIAGTGQSIGEGRPVVVGPRALTRNINHSPVGVSNEGNQLSVQFTKFWCHRGQTVLPQILGQRF
jgi:hypothetical protein